MEIPERHARALRWRVDQSLALRLTLVMGAVAAVTAAFLALLSFFVSQHLIADKIRSASALQTESLARHIVFEIDAVQALLNGMAGNAFISNALVDSLGRDQYLLPYLRDQTIPGGTSAGLWVVDFAGKPIAGKRAGDFEHRDSAAVQAAIAGRQAMVELVHEHGLLLAVPVVFPPTGSVEGAVVAVLDWRELLAGAGTLVAADGCFLLQVGDRVLPIPDGCRVASPLPVITRRLDLPPGFRPLNAELRLHVADAAGTAATRALIPGYLLVIGIVLAAVLLASRTMARRIITPLTRLTDIADRIVRQSRLDLRAPEGGRDETGRLASAFNAMLDSLQAARTRLEGDIAQRQIVEQALAKSEEKYRLLIEHQTDLVVKVAPDNRFLYVSPSYCTVFGKSEVELLGHTFMPLVHEDDRESTARAMADLFRPPYRDYHEQRALTSSGWRWFGWADTAVLGDDGEVIAIVGVGRDITERREAEEALFEAKERAQVTLHSIGDAVITTDALGRVEYLNPVAEQMTGWTTIDARERALAEVFHIVDESTRATTPDPVERCLREGKVVGLANHSILVSRHGVEHHIDDSAAPIRGRDGRILGAVLVFHDVTETRSLARQLEHDATHDALTGLINRPEFERRVTRALTSSQQYRTQHALCYLDLDQFKLVNDTAGHAAGDELLRQIRKLMSSMFRERDTLARIGGDEFGLLLDNCPLGRAQSIARSVVSAVRDYLFHWDGRSYQIGVSIGLVPVTAATRDTAELFKQADVACYTAKELGRNQVHVYQRADSESAQRHSEILGAAGLRDALEQDRFRLHYQPIISLAAADDSAPTRYEALLRVVDSGDADDAAKLVLPAAFIPAAERFGLMGDIDRWVIRTACADYAQGAGRTGAEIAINLSGNSLGDDSLLGFIEAQFAAHAVPADKVCFEITETAAIQNLRHAAELMTQLRRHGCHLALDDFGSGLSSFRYLKTLPVDYLKIDGSFVRDMLNNPSDDALVAAINEMSHALGMRTIAEYVESQAIVDRLRELGVDHAQGYWIGKPAAWDTPSGRPSA